MRLYTSAVETPGVTAQQKITELQHYFEGAALLLVEAETIKADHELAYVEACSKLNEKFGMKRETAVEMMEEALSGKVIHDKDAGALLNLYATLSSIHAMAKETGRETEFENRTAIDAVLKKKVPHYAGK